MKSGETQLWRLANIGPENYLTVALPGHKFHVLAEDGSPVWKVWDNDTLFLPSGKRFDVLVTATGNGSIPLGVVNNSYNDEHDNLIATINIQGNQKDMKPVNKSFSRKTESSSLMALYTPASYAPSDPPP
jgi:suppressor of ftsI